jgi:hypothetical protein
MNGKIITAFIAGAVLASGIVYVAVRPASPPAPVSIADVRPASEIPPPSPPTALPGKTAPAPAGVVKPPTAPEPKPVPQRVKLARTPIREKPSPMPPVRREQPPVVIARNPVVVARNEVKTETPPIPASPDPVLAPPAVIPQAAPPPPPPAPEPLPVIPVVAKPPLIPDAPVPHTVILAAGTPLTVRIGETVSAARNQVGDTFVATLEQPLVIDGFIICERGSRVVGKVTQATPAGRAGGQSHLSIELTRLSSSDGQRVQIHTDPYVKAGSGSTGGDLAKVAAGTAIGAAIGAMAGGGKGAAIGAGAGAAAGTGVVLVSNGKSVEVPVEARLTFRVKEPVTITERLD